MAALEEELEGAQVVLKLRYHNRKSQITVGNNGFILKEFRITAGIL